MSKNTVKRTFVIGDIHGRLEALQQCLHKSGFDMKHDKLILLGDVVDGGHNTKEVVDILLTIKDLVFVVGNHDLWFRDYLNYGDGFDDYWTWYHQGGENTIKSYGLYNTPEKRFEVDAKHRLFFLSDWVPRYEENNILFIHGGFDPKRPLHSQKLTYVVWDRNLISVARRRNIPKYKHIFVGHTTTQSLNLVTKPTTPITYNNLTVLDTGAGWDGKLTIMNVATREYWQSDTQEAPG